MPIYHYRKGEPIQSISSPTNLTSDTSNPEWELLSDSVFSSSYPMYKAFDGKPGGYLDGWLSAEVSGDHWLGIRHVGSPVRVTEYGFYPAWSGGNDAPKTWVFQGSHNGVVWETLDSQSDVSIPMESKEYKYTLASPAEYEYYRLYVTANQGGHTYLAIGEFILYGGLIYPASSGFDEFGYPIAYDNARDAGCGLINPWQSPDNLTANDSNPAFILNQSSQFNSNTTAFRAFDGSLNLGQWKSGTYNSADYVDTAWITIQLDEANSVNYLKLISAGYFNSCQPADFNLEYSDDGSTWTPCLEVRGLTQAWWNTPDVGTEHEWAVASSGKHKHYRLNMLTRVANASYNIQRMEIGVK